MMGWLSRNSNPVVIERKKVDPGATFSLLENHWKQATEVMCNTGDVMSAEAALTVISHLNQMISFLRLARTEDPEQDCKQFWIRNRCSDKVIKWLHALQIQGMQLMYEDEKKLVQTLQSLCEVASKDGELLGYTMSGSSRSDAELESWDGACSLFSLLLEYSLKSDPCLGEPARNSFIHLIQLASRFPDLEKSFSQETGLGLTNVVISGLSACFAQLPTFAAGSSEQLYPFITQLKFVDSVTHAAPAKVSLTIADCFSNAFLHAVILPALTQDEGNRSLHRQDDQFVTSLHEEIAVVTNYLKIICEHLTHPLLIKSLMGFVISNLLAVFIQRMNHPNTAVTVSTLGLLNVLLNFYCEDFWYELILRHLMSLNHLMVSQRTQSIPEVDFQESSVRFLSLIPGPVIDVMGPEAIMYHYLQYLTNELSRWSSFEEFSISLTPPDSPLGESTSTKYNNNNPVFSMWKYKYDGTDVIETNSKKVTRVKSVDESPVAPETQGAKTTNDDPLTLAMVEDDVEAESGSVGTKVDEPFTTISLQPSVDEMNSIETSEPSIHENDSIDINAVEGRNQSNTSDGYGSLESNSGIGIIGVSDSPASFGPFFDVLLNHLKNVTRLPPDIILMVTEVIGTLAASRVPIVTCILLDQNIILQPSYVKFNLLLNQIRVELEQSLRNNQSVLSDIWSSMSKDLQPSSQHRDSFSSSLLNSLDSSFGDNSFTESLKKKITSGGGSLVPFFNNVFQRKSGGGSSNSSQIESPIRSPSAPNLNDSVQSLGTQSYRYVNRTPPNQQQNQSTEAIKLMATRAIFFSHFLLELASISQQLCWKKPVV